MAGAGGKTSVVFANRALNRLAVRGAIIVHWQIVRVLKFRRLQPSSGIASQQLVCFTIRSLFRLEMEQTQMESAGLPPPARSGPAATQQ
jgi:hypothetical protein